jgi:ribose 5-phosphate isomerase B
MRIALGADHAGVGLKDQVKRQLDARGIAYTDFGTTSTESVDYPDVAARVAHEVVSGAYDRGILACGTGIGMAIAANKIAGIRAAPVVDERSAALSREHNDANVLALGARVTSPDLATRLVDIFLDTPFDGGRHARRIDKITALEQVAR